MYDAALEKLNKNSLYWVNTSDNEMVNLQQ